MTKEELDLVDTQDLISALARRAGAVVVAFEGKPERAEDPTPRRTMFRSHGSIAARIGLLRLMEQFLIGTEFIPAVMQPDDEDDEG